MRDASIKLPQSSTLGIAYESAFPPLAESVKAVYAGVFTNQKLAALSNLVFQA